MQTAITTQLTFVSIEERFESFVAVNRDKAVRLAWRLTGEDLATAEDVAQDAFVKAHSALHRFRGDSELSTWFYKILVRQASNRRRWKQVRDRFVSLWNPEDLAQEGQEQDLVLQDKILKALDSLSTVQRTFVVLVYVEGLKIEEAAVLTGKAPGTVKTHLFRARASLKEQLAEIREL